MAEKFAALSETTQYRTPVNNEFQAQRDRLSKFYESFNDGLRRVRNEMEHEIGLLKMRGFDRKMLHLMSQVHNTILEIYKTIDPNKPYIAAEKLVRYVTERPSMPIIDNLDFLAKHHIKQTNVDFKPGKFLVHPEIRSFDALKKLTTELRNFMVAHPLITTPTISPVSGLGDVVKDLGGEAKSGKEEKTRA